MKGGFALGLTNRCGWTDISKIKVDDDDLAEWDKLPEVNKYIRWCSISLVL